MLSDLEVGQFRAFGYIVLKQCLSPAEFKRLEAAYERVMATAPLYNYFDPDSRTKMLNPSIEADEAIGNLIEHPGIMAAMRDVWGTEGLWIGGSDMWGNLDETPWHSDYQPGRAGQTVKVAIYLDKTDQGQGALNVIPGSHHPEYCAAIFQACGQYEKGMRPRLRLDRDKIPGAVSLQTSPGDVVLWDNRIWHSAWKRRDGQVRRNLFLSYMPDPQDDLLAGYDLRSSIKSILGSKRAYLYSKEMMHHASPLREKTVSRLEELGVEHVREE